MIEQEFIQTAIDKLKQQTGLDVVYHAFEKDNDFGEILLPGCNHGLVVKCKKWLNKNNLQRFFAELELNHLIGDIVLITDYVNTNQATLLKERSVPFMDLAGNTYINRPPVYIDIQGKKPEKLDNKLAHIKQLGKAFQPKGMKVVFMLLIQPELVNKPMRAIADTAEVALGTVKQVLDDLVYQGFIVQRAQRTKELVNKKKLLDKWLDAYPTTLEAKLRKEVYTADKLELLRKLDLTDMGALWGGEYAAELCDNYLKTKDYLIYVQPEQKNEILKTAKLRKTKPGENLDQTAARVILAELPLAIDKVKGKQDCLAHPYLIYANLLASQNPRIIDAATRFYEKHIA